MDRRRFLARAAGACAAFTFQAETLRLLFIRGFASVGVASAERGIHLGAEEAARTGALMGRTVELRTVDGPRPEEIAAARPDALIGGYSPDWLRTLAGIAEGAGIPLLNVDVGDDSLRGPDCHPLLLHLAPSDAMLSAARGDSPPGTFATAWHHSLERFGAAQLNERYRARFGAEMDGAAWAGWMAVKTLWEASLRARSTAPSALLAHLRAPSTQFDGHKGWPLSFRPWDGQLRQPLYLVAGEGESARLVGEVPIRSAEADESSRAQLDRLAGDASSTTCTAREAR
jgi:ABC-type branched-subunit amino acid transport system substrate-binding protein